MSFRPRLLVALLVACGAFLLTAPAQAQQRTIDGTVTDAQTGEGLPGASVSVPGTTVGTATDAEGAYELSVPADADSLRFSFVGYQARTVAIAGRSTIDIALQPETREIEELVVIGYGEQQARDVTGTLEKVDAADFNQSANISPEQLISGKIAGVQISQASGAPGSGSFIRIRGPSSVNAGSDPLFVIDGVPLSGDDNTAQRNPLNFLNPNDIASITVLKDASSTAIYGARGANGVILIETKNADEEEGRVTYSGSVSANRITDRIDILDAGQFRNVVNEQAPSVAGQLGFANTDWQDRIQRDAIGQQHSLSYSRGYDDADLRVSLGYTTEQGVLYRSSSERVSGSINYNQDLFDNQLTFRTKLRAAKNTETFEPGGMLGSAITFDPTQPVRDVDSPFGGFYEWSGELPENNPVASYVLETNTGESYSGLGNIEAEYRVPFLTGLSLRANGGFDLTTGEREFFAPTDLKAQAEGEFPGNITRATFRQLNTRFNAFLNYDRDIESINSSLDVTAGYSYQEFDEEYPEYSANGLSTDIYGQNNIVLRADSSVEDGGVVRRSQVIPTVAEIPSRLISVFGRINYRFLDRYLLTATVRRDGSSKFGPANRFGTFPSAALAWQIAEEPFMESLNDALGEGAISTLKLRLSAGITGNDGIEDFRYEPLYTSGGARAQAIFGGEPVPTIRPDPADEGIQWEEVTTYNIGLDYGVLNDRISGSVELYRKDTDELLFEITPAGFSNLSNFLLTNVGSMRNQGVEFSIDGQVVQSDLVSYNAQFNASYNQNELLSIDESVGEGIPTGGIAGGIGNTIQVIRPGAPINAFFTFIHKRGPNGEPLPDGVDHNGDGTINDADIYRDINGDDVVNQDDRTITGSPQPDWVLGHTSQLRVQNFDLSFTLRAQLGQQVYNNVASQFGHFSRIGTNQVPSNIHESALENQFDDPQYFSDVYVEDADFLRVDNITLGYTFRSIPAVDQLRLFGQVNNAFVLTGYSGPDPEVYSEGQGIDNTVYPRARTFRAGLNLQF
jgi:iron complex outermembrane receptor protein